MKIIKIEIENLNSLKGKWTIDLEHPDYGKNHDQFVICGQTGSGKTTILDAITLALYGRTPRQKKINATTNEIMSRETGYCRAAVTYTCGRGVIVSEFSQRKAHNKKDGKLQSPEFYVNNTSVSGEQWSGKAAEGLAEKTIEYLNLDYNQFCQSILLAQGEFDRFLVGSGGTADVERDRAAILAKLTGTEYYKRIGKKICEIAETKKEFFEKKDKEYCELKEKIGEVDENALINKIEELTNQKKEVDEEQTKVTAALTWIKDFDKKKNNLDKAKEAIADYEKAEKAFLDDRKRLEAGKRAEACAAKFEIFNGLRKADDLDRKDLERYNASLPDIESAVEKAKKESEDAKEVYEDEAKKLEKSRSLWSDVRILDTKLEAQKTSVNEARSRRDKAVEDKENGEKDLKDYDNKLRNIEDELGTIRKYLEENSIDKKIAGILPDIRSFRDQLETVYKDISGCLTEMDKKTSERTDCEDLQKKAQESIDKLNEELRKLITEEYKPIVQILRSTLEKGKACPVCGSFEHAACDDEEIEIGKEATDDNNPASRVMNISDEIESTQNSKDSLEKRIREIDIEIDALEKKREGCFITKNSLIDKINGSIWQFDMKLDRELEEGESGYIEGLDEIIGSLEVRSNNYSNRKSEKDRKELEQKGIRAKREAIDLKKLKDVLDEATGDYGRKKSKLDGLKNNRKELFGDKDVDKVEEEETAQVNKFKAESENAAILFSYKERDHGLLKQSINNCLKRIEAREEELNISAGNFEMALKDNGFESEEDFMVASIDSKELDSLNEKAEELKSCKNRIEQALKMAEEEYNDKLKEKNTDLTVDELQAGLDELKIKHDEIVGNINEKKKAVEEHKRNLSNVSKLKDEHESLKIEMEKWKTLRSAIGKKNDGSDFEVFVQGRIFRILLQYANEYLYSISGERYTFVQKDMAVDFLIHDEEHKEAKYDRAINNMSGGEKFIISLSLALALARIASRGTTVESLFLDEGFGTLSGKYLEEAIAALKKLQETGKMLGIITHVEAVIDEFDQKIEAVPQPGGVSILRGSGITKD